MSPTEQHASPKRVLVVDDEVRLCDIIQFYLKDAGYDVVLAHSGNEAWRILGTERIDAVVTDIRMPDGTGIELLDRIKARTPHRPVVLFMTAHSDISVEDAYEKGANALLSKPVKSGLLLQALNRAMESAPSRWRQHARLDVDLAVDLHLETQVISASASNLGRGGAFICLTPDIMPAVGATVRFKISIELDEAMPVEGEGIVRWRRIDAGSSGMPTGVGIEFTALSEASQAAVSAAVDRLQLRAFIPKS